MSENKNDQHDNKDDQHRGNQNDQRQDQNLPQKDDKGVPNRDTPTADKPAPSEFDQDDEQKHEKNNPTSGMR